MLQKPKLLTVLDVAAIASFLAATGLVFFYAPLERVMGAVQKVFYFHVASGWVGMLSFAVAAVVGVIYLIRKDLKWDSVGVAAVEIGIAFTLINVVTGAIWARPIWNTWWTWDPRLTTATIMELVYFAYLMLRSGIEEPERRARFGAVYAIIGFLSVPLTFFSIRLFRTIHPVVIGSNDPGAMGAFDMTPRMTQVFLFSLLAFTIVYFDLLWHRIRLGKLAERVESLRLKLQA
ncbi:ABC-type transport system [Bellilinea caldifistulae]|uniref:Heme exporter protein C n=1 Tax=Bellilinea caldifistulae TaxID=360411 RepID=A0A0P6XBG9_9CHLR|nr:cytochrome c biogenesis protein CcsA [Bellilinea caldifistulae]KPL77100.1 cytochrome C assembly protein [Bellilinea caldifistulae]GAP10045.1 ABC-type transport system [Bellilinea caldifistulae]